MKNGKRIFVILTIVLCSILCAAFGAMFYLYFHPDTTKSLVERYVSEATGGTLTIEDLSYSLNPLSMNAKGIVLEKGMKKRGPSGRIREIFAEAELRGAFGGKTLLVKRLRLEGLRAEIPSYQILKKFMVKRRGSSFFPRFFGKLFSLFVYRDVKIERAEVSDAAFVAEFSGMRFSAERVHGRLAPDRRLEITLGIRVEDDAQSRILSVPKVKIGSAVNVVSQRGGREAVFYVEGGTYSSSEVVIHDIRATATLEYHNGKGPLINGKIDVSSKNIFLEDGKGEAKDPIPLTFSAKGSFSGPDALISIEQFDLDSGEILHMRGRCEGRLNPNITFTILFSKSHISPEGLAPLMPVNIRDIAETIGLQGEVGLSGTLKTFQRGEALGLEGDIETEFKGNHFATEENGTRIEGLLTGSIRAKGSLEDLLIHVMLEGHGAHIFRGGFSLRPSVMYLETALSYPDLAISKFSLSIPEASFAYGNQDIPVTDLQLTIPRGNFEVKRKSIQLPEINLQSSLLRNIRASLELIENRLIFELKGRDVNLLNTMNALGVFPLACRFQGKDEIEVNGVVEEHGTFSFDTKLNFDSVDFESEDGTCMGEGIHAHAQSDGTADRGMAWISSDVFFSMDSGEILYDRFYVDLKKNSLICSSELEYNPSEKVLRLENANLGFKDIIRLELQGSIAHEGEGPRMKLSGHIPETPLKPLFSNLIKEPYRTERPVLGTMEADGGLSGNFTLETSGASLEMRGQWVLRDGMVSSGEDMAITGLDFSLPIHIQKGPNRDDAPNGEGHLSAEVIQIPGFPKQGLEVTLHSRPNSFYVNNPVRLRIPGGDLILEETAIKNVFGPEHTLTTNLTLQIEDINDILPSIWPGSIRGNAKGNLSPLVYSRGRVTTEGEIEVHVFDGELIVSGVAASGILTSVPLIKFDTEIRDLSLEKLTTGTSFGRIEGVLRGKIEDLEIAYGQPQKFDLLLETVRREGVSQQISVKAVDNIARIGGGSSPFMGLAGAVSEFLNEFSYEKIGIRASLENDVFRVNGTIQEGGKEYLVKRGGFSGVNIVNQNPDNRISFRDMIKRIRRVTEGGSSPIIR